MGILSNAQQMLWFAVAQEYLWYFQKCFMAVSNLEEGSALHWNFMKELDGQKNEPLSSLEI